MQKDDTRHLKRLFLWTIFLISTVASFGQDNPDCYVEKDFLIVYSTKDYEHALLVAIEATKAIGIPINLNERASRPRF